MDINHNLFAKTGIAQLKQIETNCLKVKKKKKYTEHKQKMLRKSQHLKPKGNYVDLEIKLLTK